LHLATTLLGRAGATGTVDDVSLGVLTGVYCSGLLDADDAEAVEAVATRVLRRDAPDRPKSIDVAAVLRAAESESSLLRADDSATLGAALGLEYPTFAHANCDAATAVLALAGRLMLKS